MKTPDQEAIRELAAGWESRTSDPVNAARLIAQFADKWGVTPHEVALYLDARAAEIPAYLNLLQLSPEAQRVLIDSGLPISLASEMMLEQPETHAKLIADALAKVRNAGDPVGKFCAAIHESLASSRVGVDKITHEHLKHAGEKAVVHSVLSPKQQAGLRSMAAQWKKKGSLSVKQVSWANELLSRLQDRLILTADCGKPSCSLCADFRRIAGKA